MKLATLMHEMTRRPMTAALAAVAGMAMAAAPASAQDYYDEHYEWEAGEGVHEEEWYDPSDWFDDDYEGEQLVDYEYDRWDGDYGYDEYGYGYEPYYYEDDGYYDDYDDGYYGDYYDEHYEWEPDEGVHEEEWYDPSDWFDDDWNEQLVDYEEDWWEGGDDYQDYGDDYYGYDDGTPRYDYDDYDVYRDDYRADRAAQNQRPNQQRADRPDAMRQAQNAELRGQLDGWSRVSLQGQRDAHTLVRLRLENGRSAVVNLGPNVSVDRLNLDRGDRVAVWGPEGKIDGRNVLMAKKVRVGEQTITMRNWQQDRQQREARAQESRRPMNADRQAQQGSGQRLMLRGELEDARRVNLAGQRDANTLVRVRLEDGRRATVNLGPNVSLATLSDMNAEMGDRVTVWGHRRSMENGRSVVVAERVKIGDQTKTLDWQGQDRQTSRR